MSFVRFVSALILLCAGVGVSPLPPDARAAQGPESCDPPAVGLAVGAQVDGDIPATSAPYPANARYYCIRVGEGTGSVTIRLEGLSADLDLYVGYGTIDSVQGVDISAGETYDWKSNAFGTEPEEVTISAPRPGLYYLEIVSFQGDYSPFRLTVR